MKPINPNLFIVILIGCLFGNNSLLAQSDLSQKKSFFKAGINYLTNDVYAGRKDSANVSYLRSSIGYYHKSGFHIDGDISILMNSAYQKRIDMASMEAGYDFNINDKFAGGLYASKYFYNAASFAINSEMKELTGAYLSYNLGPVALEAGANLAFSTNTDFSSSLNLSHAFGLGNENNKCTITPTAQLNAGTQYFNEAYYEYRKFTFETNTSNSGKGKGKGHSSSKNNGTTTTVKTLTFNDKNKFTILDYEISCPINYEVKRFTFFVNPVFAIPVNPASYAIDNTLQKEKLSNTFFAEIGAYITFGEKH